MRKRDDAAVLVEGHNRWKTLDELQAETWRLYDEITERSCAMNAAADLKHTTQRQPRGHDG